MKHGQTANDRIKGRIYCVKNHDQREAKKLSAEKQMVKRIERTRKSKNGQVWVRNGLECEKGKSMKSMKKPITIITHLLLLIYPKQANAGRLLANEAKTREQWWINCSAPKPPYKALPYAQQTNTHTYTYIHTHFVVAAAFILRIPNDREWVLYTEKPYTSCRSAESTANNDNDWWWYEMVCTRQTTKMKLGLYRSARDRHHQYQQPMKIEGNGKIENNKPHKSI